MFTSHRTPFRALALTIFLALTLMLPACHRSSDKTAAEIKADVVASLLKGMKRHGSQISAERYDAQAQELRAVHVTGKEGVLYAERATITVDEKSKAVCMKLFDVIVAQPVDEDHPADPPAQGQVVKYRELVLDDIGSP